MRSRRSTSEAFDPPPRGYAAAMLGSAQASAPSAAPLSKLTPKLPSTASRATLSVEVSECVRSSRRCRRTLRLLSLGFRSFSLEKFSLIPFH